MRIFDERPGTRFQQSYIVGERDDYSARRVQKMTIALNEALIYKMKHKSKGLTNDECIALNLFWRKNVNVLILSKVFKASKNTIYYRALTGTAESYSSPAYANSAADTNALIDKLGVEKAWNTYVTNDMVKAVEAEMQAELERRDSHGS